MGVARGPHFQPLFGGRAGRLRPLPRPDDDEGPIAQRDRILLAISGNTARTITERVLKVVDLDPAVHSRIEYDRIFIGRVYEEHPGHRIGILVEVHPGEDSAERLAYEYDRLSNAGPFQERVKIGDFGVHGAGLRAGIALAGTRAIVGAR